MNLCKRYTPLALAALLVQSSLGQDFEEWGGKKLRGGNERKPSSTDPENLFPLGSDTESLLTLDSKSVLRRNDETMDEPERIIVRCKQDQDEDDCRNQILAALSPERRSGENSSVKIFHRLKKENAFALSAKQLDALMEKLGNADFESFPDPVREPMHIEESLVIHDRRELQSGSQRVPYGINMVKAQEVWDEYNVRGENVKVCVLDTGLQSNHPDFDSDKLSGYNGREAVTPWNNDRDGHGTHVTGTIAASDNNLGVVGVAPEVEVYTVRVFNNNGRFFGSDVVAAVEACQDAGANVISMSLGGPRSSFFERRTLEDLYEDGIISVASAGNSGSSNFLYPAAYDIVVSVGAVDSNRRLAGFSTFNSRVDVAAPGLRVISTWNNGRYATLSGTSMAAPHVSGVIALMRSYNKDSTPDEIINALKATAENPETDGRNNRYGHGIVNAMAAIDAIGGGAGEEANSPTASPISRPGDDEDSDDGGPQCLQITMDLMTDRFGIETSYAMISLADGTRLWARSRLLPNRRYIENACVNPSSCYRFYIQDSYGDGIIGDGVTLSIGGEVVYEGGNFGRGGYRNIGEGCPA